MKLKLCQFQLVVILENNKSNFALKSKNSVLEFGNKLLKMRIRKNPSSFFESLILAQDERWRRALSMQVERLRKEQWRTVE